MPDEARKARPDAMICTGRSDFPNQVNNVLCFPFIFRGALDVGATAINEEMKHAAVDAIAQLARDPPSDAVAQGFDTGETQGFGPGSLIPSPFDPRLILRIAPAVAKAAMDSGVATRPIKNFDEYRALLERFAFRSGLVMKPVFAKAKTQPVRVIYAEGEDERVLRATQVVLEEKLARPILVGRPSVVEARHQAVRPVDQGRAGFRPRQSRGRSALPFLCADPISTSPAGTASRPMPRARWCAPTRP